MTILQAWLRQRHELAIENAALKRALRAALEQMSNAEADRDAAQLRQGELEDELEFADE